MVALNNKEILIIKVRILGLSIDLVSLLAIVIDKKVAKTTISFLIVLDMSLNNGFFYYNYNI